MSIHLNPTHWHLSLLTLRLCRDTEPFKIMRFLRVGPIVVSWERDA